MREPVYTDQCRVNISTFRGCETKGWSGMFGLQAFENFTLKS